MDIQVVKMDMDPPRSHSLQKLGSDDLAAFFVEYSPCYICHNELGILDIASGGAPEK